MAITLADAVVMVGGELSQLDKDLSKGEKKTKGWVKNLSGTVRNLLGGVLKAGIIGATGAVVGLGAAVTKFTLDAAAVEGVTNTFESLVESVGGDAVSAMDDLRIATRGMISDADLMQAGNKFLAMGIANTVEEAAALSEVATQLGSAMGEDATASMENFALMMANQSIPRLDSFGISSGEAKKRVEELMAATEGMTKEAAFNQAVMELAAVTMEKVGEQGDNLAGSMSRVKAFMSNVGISIGKSFLPIGEKLVAWIANVAEDVGPVLIGWFNDLGDIFVMLLEKSTPVTEWFEDVWVLFESKVVPIVNTLFDAIKALITGDVEGFWQRLGLVLHELGVPIDVIDKLREYSEAVGTYWNDTLKPAIVELWTNTLKPALEGLWQLVVDLKPVIIALGIAILAFVVAPMLLAALPVVALAVALVGLGLMWRKHGDEVKQIVTQIGVIISHVFGKAIEWIMTFVEAIASSDGIFKQFLEGMGINLDSMLEGLDKAKIKMEELRNAGIANVTAAPVESQFDPTFMGGFGGLFEQLFGQGNQDNSSAFTNYGGIQQYGFGSAENAIESLWEQSIP